MMEQKTVFVTGANGFVGRATVDSFLENGWRVRAAVRVTPQCGSQAGNNLFYIPIGDIAGVVDWQPYLSDCNAVVHLAARAHKTSELSTDGAYEFERINVHSSRRLAEGAIKAGVERFVFISSAGVMGEQSVSPFREDDEPDPRSEYAKSKHRAELALKAIAMNSRTDLVILRPTLVYGAGNPGNLARLEKLLRLGLPLPFAGVRNQRSLLHVGQLARIILEATTNPAAVNQTFLVSDGMDVATPELFEALADAMGVGLRLFRLSPSLLRGLASVVGKGDEINKLSGSFCVDSSLVRRRLGIKAISTVETIRSIAGFA